MIASRFLYSCTAPVPGAAVSKALSGTSVAAEPTDSPRDRPATAPGAREFWVHFAVVLAAAAYLAVHVVTLARSPLPWFDDTFSASVAESLYKTGELKLQVAPLYFDKPVYIYGPMYFLITGAFLNWFGVDVFQFRLPALLFSLGVVVMTFLLLRQRKVYPMVAIAVCTLLALDPTFYRGSHIGRMDSTALFLLLLSLFLVVREDHKDRQRLTWLMMSGLSAAMALLTTPRPAYMALLIGGILLYRAVRTRDRQNIIQLTIWSASCFLPWIVWLFYAFGSIPDLVAYYALVPGGPYPGGFHGYLGGFHVRLEHYPLLVGLAVLLTVRLTRKPKLIVDASLFFALAGITCFYLIVHDAGGTYAFFMVPLAYLAVGCLITGFVGRQKWLPLVIVGLLLCINASIYIARNTLVWLQWEARDAKVVGQVVATLLPPGSRVVGDEEYYFAVKKSGSDFQYLLHGGTLAERLRYHKNVYRPDFLITANSGGSETVKAYVSELHLVKLQSIEARPERPAAQWITRVATRLGFVPSTGYQGTIWGRVDEAR